MNKEVFNALTALVGVGENGGVMSWMVKAHEEYGIEYGNLVKAYAALPEMQWCFKEGKTCYLRNTNFAYINCGIKGNLETDVLIISQQFIASSQNTHTVFGDYANTSKAITVNIDTTGSGTRTQRFGAKYGDGSKCSVGQKVKITTNKKSFCVNDIKAIDFNCTTQFTTAANLTLYKMNSFTNTSYTDGESGVSVCCIKESNVTKRFFVPSKNTNGDYCMFDLVSGTFYENQGTGSFSIEVIND